MSSHSPGSNPMFVSVSVSFLFLNPISVVYNPSSGDRAFSNKNSLLYRSFPANSI